MTALYVRRVDRVAVHDRCYDKVTAPSRQQRGDWITECRLHAINVSRFSASPRNTKADNKPRIALLGRRTECRW